MVFHREYSTRFLNAFIRIEQSLSHINGASKHKPFYQMVNDAAVKNVLVRDLAVELKEYGDLRNAIVHERIDDQPIAEPHPETVKRLEKISELLSSPPKVKDEFIKPVITCEIDEEIIGAITKMRDHSFSKIPVYNHQGLVGLLTAEAVTHWLADNLGNDTRDLSREKVLAVLPYVDKSDNYRIVSTECSLFKALSLFEECSHKGRNLEVVLITETGTKYEKPVGVITVFDLPRIYQILE